MKFRKRLKRDRGGTEDAENEYLSEINLDDRFELREIRLGEAVEAAGVEKLVFLQVRPALKNDGRTCYKGAGVFSCGS